MLSRLIRYLPGDATGSMRGSFVIVVALCLCLLSFLNTGCSGTSASSVKAGSISVSTTTLSVTETTKLSMTPTGDKSNAGVDWTVTCGGSPVTGSITGGACGTLAPTHTAAGATTVYTAPAVVPIGTTVTITAAVTSNPSQTSSTSLTIIAVPISISFTSSGALSSMDVNTTTALTATVTNDTNDAGVNWTATCGSGACGSFSPTQTASGVATTYTAPSAIPSGNTVTLTATSATDTTKSFSKTITITTPVTTPISVSITPSNISAANSGSGRTAHPIAFVLNDSAAKGVNWSTSCSLSSCGTITSSTASGSAATYLAPSGAAVGSTITLTATSVSDTTKSASATVTIVSATPISITMTSTPSASMKTGALATLAATASSGSDGINWTATCGSTGACGSFSLSPAHTTSGGQIVYTAPSSVPTGSVVTITASSASSSPANPTAAQTTIVASTPTPTLSFTEAPPATLSSTASTPVSVAVANDPTSEGVTWSAQCSSSTDGGCGWFSPVTTASGIETVYTAPPVSTTGTSVTLVATSVVNSSVSISSSAIAIAPDTTLTLSFVPYLPAQVQMNTTVNLNAAVANDTTAAGVDWQVCSSGCGFFTTKPAVPAIEATATTSYVSAQPAVTATSVSGWPNGLPIPYTAPTDAPASGTVAVIARAHANTSVANSGTITITSEVTGPALTGIVKAGSTPIVGASVALYVAGTSGYASAATQIASATSNSSGVFTIPAGYTCASTNQMYLVATGGQVGSYDANANLALMTALGGCSNLSSSYVVVNEVTTIASAQATAPFAANDALNGNSSYLYLGASSSNQTGLANAFAAVNNLVDITTGKARYFVPAANAEVPYVKINTLADVLNACAASSGGVEGDGSNCGVLFLATDLLGNGTYGASVAPTDTLQAAFNIAQHPISNYGYYLDQSSTFPLFGLATTSSPYLPILSSSPHDWSISLHYTSGGGLTSSSVVVSFAIDASGNVWISDTNADSVIEWNPAGVAVSPSTGFSAGGGPLAIDASGNVWTSGNSALYELSNIGDAYPWSPFGGVTGSGGDMAIDAKSNLWITNPAGVNEFTSLGQQLSPTAGYTNDGVTSVTALGIDSSNNVWLGNSDTASSLVKYAEIGNPGGQLIYNGSLAYGSEIYPGIAADSAGKTWAIAGTQVCKIPAYGGTGANLQSTCYAGGGATAGGLYFETPRGLALDGGGTVWVASQGLSGTSSLPAGIFPLNVSLSDYTNAKPYAASSLSSGALRVAVDGAGNAWVLLADNTVTEFVGVATPVVTPLALGLKNKKLATKP